MQTVKEYGEEVREESRIVDLSLYRKCLEREEAEQPVHCGGPEDGLQEAEEEKGTFLRELREWSRWFLDVFASVCVALLTLAMTLFVLGL